MLVSGTEIEANCLVIEVSLEGLGSVPVPQHQCLTLLLPIRVALGLEALVVCRRRAERFLPGGSAVEVDAHLPGGEARSPNFSLYLINDLRDLVLGEVREVVLGREGEEGVREVLTVAHQVQQFEVVVAVGRPHAVAAHPLQPLQPLLQPDPHVLPAPLEKGALLDLPPRQLVLRLLHRLPLRRGGDGDAVQGVALREVVFEIGHEGDALLHVVFPNQQQKLLHCYRRAMRSVQLVHAAVVGLHRGLLAAARLRNRHGCARLVVAALLTLARLACPLRLLLLLAALPDLEDLAPSRPVQRGGGLFGEGDGGDGRERLEAHALVDAVDELLVVPDGLHELADPALVEEELALVGGVGHETLQLADLLLGLLDVALEDVDLVPAVHVDVLHHLLALFLLPLPPEGHDPLARSPEPRLALLHPRLRQHALLRVDGALVKVEQLREPAHHRPPVVQHLAHERVARKVEAARLRKEVEEPVVGLNLVVSEVDGGERRRALPQLLEGGEERQEVLAEREVLQLREFGEPLDHEDAVIGEVEDAELLEAFEVLDALDHVVLEEEVLELLEAFEALDADDHVVLEVERLEAHVLLQPRDPLHHLVVQVDLLVHLRELVQPVHLADLPQVCLTHHQPARLRPLQLPHPPGHPQRHGAERLVGRLQQARVPSLVRLHPVIYQQIVSNLRMKKCRISAGSRSCCRSPGRPAPAPPAGSSA